MAECHLQCLVVFILFIWRQDIASRKRVIDLFDWVIALYAIPWIYILLYFIGQGIIYVMSSKETCEKWATFIVV